MMNRLVELKALRKTRYLTQAEWMEVVDIMESALKEIRRENNRAMREFTNVSNQLLKRAYDAALEGVW